MKIIIIPFFILSLFSINSKKLEFVKENKKVVYIQPLGNVNQKYILESKKSIEDFYNYDCIIKPKIELTPDLLSPSKKRYDALKILYKFKSSENILIITEKDITAKKGQNSEWGVLGLGFRPGTVCVVSTFRMKRNSNETKILDRIRKVSIHEVGHNLGLDHCKNDIHCLMNDANGTISQVDREKIWICKKCENQIKNK